MRVRPANRSDHEAVAAVLAAAFSTDPPLSFLLPDARRRERLLRRHFAASIPLYASAGAVWVAEDGSGAALWVAPGCYPFRMREELRVARARLEVFGRWARRGIGAQRALDRHHPREPHWYLDYVGVEPAGQGRGLGSALLAPMLARCDTERRGAYLNAGSPRSRELYLRHGFGVRSELRLPFGGPPRWRMWREPQASTSSPLSAS